MPESVCPGVHGVGSGGLSFGEGIAEGRVVRAGRDVELAGNRGDAGSKGHV